MGPAPGAQGAHEEPWRVVVVDDDLPMLDLLQKVVARHPVFRVVAVASNADDAVAVCAGERPDLVLMDIVMPQRSGIDAIRDIKEADPAIRCLALTAVVRSDVLFEALRAGACGYLLKAAPADELYDAMQVAVTDRSFCSISAETILMAAAQAPPDPHLADFVAPPANRLALFTPREQDLVRQLAQGLNNKEVGARLHITEATVKAYLGTLCRKLGVRDRVQLLIRCYELGVAWPSLNGAGPLDGRASSLPGRG